MNQYYPPEGQGPGTNPQSYQYDPSQYPPAQPPNQGYYQQQYPAQGGAGMVTTPMSVKDWFVTMLIWFVPIANIVMLFVWGFGSSGNLNRKNWAKAALIWAGIVIVFCIIGWAIMFVIIGAMMSSGEYYY